MLSQPCRKITAGLTRTEETERGLTKGDSERAEKEVTTALWTRRYLLSKPPLAENGLQTRLINSVRTPQRSIISEVIVQKPRGKHTTDIDAMNAEIPTHRVGQGDHHERVSWPDVQIIRLHGKLGMMVTKSKMKKNREHL